MNKIFKTLDDSAAGLLNTIAEKQGKTVTRLLNQYLQSRWRARLPTSATSICSSVLTSRSKSKNSDLEMMPLNFTQLVELRRA